MNIDDVIKTIESTSAQCDETQFYIRELKDKKQNGVTELADNEALELIRYMIQCYETECALKIHTSIESIKSGAATLQSLKQFTPLHQMAQTLRKTALKTLERDIGVKQYEGEPVEMLKTFKTGIELEEQFSKLPNSMKQQMMDNQRDTIHNT